MPLRTPLTHTCSAPSASPSHTRSPALHMAVTAAPAARATAPSTRPVLGSCRHTAPVTASAAHTVPSVATAMQRRSAGKSEKQAVWERCPGAGSSAPGGARGGRALWGDCRMSGAMARGCGASRAVWAKDVMLGTRSHRPTSEHGDCKGHATRAPGHAHEECPPHVHPMAPHALGLTPPPPPRTHLRPMVHPPPRHKKAPQRDLCRRALDRDPPFAFIGTAHDST